MIRTALLLVVVLGCSLSVQATPIVIDDFSEGPLHVVKMGGTPVMFTQTGLSPEHVFGGQRAGIVGQSGPDGQSLTIDTTLQQAEFAIPTLYGYLTLLYGVRGSANAVDLTANENDRIEVSYASDMPFGFTVSFSSEFGSAEGQVSVPASSNGLGVISLATLNVYADFDPRDVSAAGFYADRLRGDIVLRDMRVVPEPISQTWVLVCLLASCRIAGERAPAVRPRQQPHALERATRSYSNGNSAPHAL